MIPRKLRSGEIAVGAPLSWDVYNADGHLLLSKGQSVRSSEQLDRLHREGIFVEVEQIWHQAPCSALQEVMHTCYQLENLLIRPEGCANFGPTITKLCEPLSAATQRAPEVVCATVVLRPGGQHAIRHVLDVACVASCVLHSMGVEGARHASCLAAALTMNLGAMELHKSLSEQSSPLTPSQQARIRVHPLASADRLNKLGVTDQLWLNAVAQHHEAFDGSGYPRHLQRDQICNEAQIISLADLFCARVRERKDRGADSTRVVLRDVLIERGRQYNSLMAAYFIKALGVYPMGTPVRLQNQETAIVCARTDAVDAPWVQMLTREHSTLKISPIRQDTRQPEFAIIDALNPFQLRLDIDMEKIWGAEARDFDLQLSPVAHVG